MRSVSEGKRLMKVNITQVPGQGSLKVNTGAGAFTDSLNEGDRVKAQVLSSAKDAAVIKTDGGHVLRAKLDAYVNLSPGDDIQLEVSGKERGTVFLSIIGTAENRGETHDQAAGQTGHAGGFTDKTLEPYASKLVELNMPVTEETARLMRELVTQNPGMTLDEAAFLASNKIKGDANIIKAAIAALYGGEKTDAMIARIAALLSFPEAGEPGIQNPEPGEFGIRNSEFGIDGRTSRESVSFSEVSSANPAGMAGGITSLMEESVRIAPLLDWLTQYTEGKTDIARNPEFATNFGQSVQDTGSAASPLINGSESANDSSLFDSESRIPNPEFSTNPTARPIISQSNTIMQSQNVEKVEIYDEITKSGFKTIEQTVKEQQKQAIPNSESRIPDSPSVSKAITQLLSEIPEFRDTPAPALERLANTLLKVANDSSNRSTNDNGGIDKLSALLDRLFTRIMKDDNNGGERLRNARKELYTRLAFIEEEISRSASPVKTEMLDQARKLMDHVRVLNDIDQFAYMQLPVKFGDERKSAELYLFKRKGGKRADPENVNILLAIDLEYMGHWEALLNFRNRDVSIQMEVPGEKEKEYIGENTVMLHEMLAEAGFKLVNTDIKYSRKETTPLTALSSFDRYISSRAGAIDFKI